MKSFFSERVRGAAIFVVLCGILGFAAWQRFSLPAVPIPDPDTWGYLRPALTWLAGDGMVQTAARGIVYPVFLLVPLAWNGGFGSIVVAQHVAGLLSGVAWWWVWTELTRHLPDDGIRRWLAPAIGLAALFAYLCATQRAVDELRLRPEAIFPLLGLLELGACLGYMRARWVDSALWRGVIWAGAAMFLALVCYSTKPSWGLAVLVAPVLIAAGIFGRGGFRPGWCVFPPAAGLLAVGVFVAVMPEVMQWKRESGADMFLPMLLFGVHANIIQQNLQSRVERGEASADEADFTSHLAMRLDESRKQVTRYEQLGFDPDFLMFHSDALQPIPAGRDAVSRKGYYYREFFAAMAARPMDFVRKWVAQMSMAYRQRPRDVFRESVVYAECYASTAGSVPPFDRELPAATALEFERMRTGADRPAGPEKVRLVPRGVGVFGTIGSVLLLPASVGVLVAGLFGGWSALRGRRLPAWSFFSWGAGLIVLASLLSNLTVAFVHSFDINRYLQLLAPMNWIVIGASLVLVAGLMNGGLSRAMRRDTSPHIPAL